MKKKLLALLLPFVMVFSLEVFAENDDEVVLFSETYLEGYLEEYSIETITFAKESKKLTKAAKNYEDLNYVAVTETGKIGKGTWWKKTKESTDMYYVGKMKNNKPTGYGFLYQKFYAIDLGISMDLEEFYYAKVYEGQFENGKMTGYGKKYLTPLEEIYYDGNNTEIVPLAFYQEVSEDIQENLYVTANPLVYEGYFKNGKYSGEGNKYEYDVENWLVSDTLYSSDLEGSGAFEDFICPTSTYEILTDDEIYSLTDAEKQMAINEIYAYNGRLFNDQSIQAYFDSKWWYTGYILPEEFDESYLSNIEKTNIDKLADSIGKTKPTTSENSADTIEQTYDKHISVYVGEFSNNKENGEMQMFYKGFLLFDGEMKKGKISGEGTQYYLESTQVRYKGEWKDGQYDGKGKEYSEDGELIYSGKWDDGDYAD